VSKANPSDSALREAAASGRNSPSPRALSADRSQFAGFSRPLEARWGHLHHRLRIGANEANPPGSLGTSQDCGEQPEQPESMGNSSRTNRHAASLGRPTS
jgi:hypothetical protein